MYMRDNIVEEFFQNKVKMKENEIQLFIQSLMVSGLKMACPFNATGWPACTGGFSTC